VEIFVEPESEAKMLLRVRDTGEGMSDHNLHVIKEIIRGNTQIVKTTNKGSTGLGYMLISELMHAHGLSVSVESNPGKGTTVSIPVPL